MDKEKRYRVGAIISISNGNYRDAVRYTEQLVELKIKRVKDMSGQY